MNEVGFLQVILILVVIGVIFYLLRLFNMVRLEKRIAKFAISSDYNDQKSLLDIIGWYINIGINKCSSLISKSYVLKKYGEKYNKFIPYDLKDKKDGTYYIAIKIVLALFVLILALISVIIHGLQVDFMVFLMAFLISFFIPDIYLNVRFFKRRKQIEEDLLKAIIIMNNAFQSGRNIMQAIECVKNELDGPIQEEFEKIYLDISYGLSLEVVFNRFYDRLKIEDAKYITTSLTLLNKTGGDIVKVFAMIEKSIFDKKNLKNELKSLTASSQFVFKLLVFLPFVLVFIIFILNPSYFSVFFTHPLGIITLVFIILFYILYILVVRKILEVRI